MSSLSIARSLDHVVNFDFTPNLLRNSAEIDGVGNRT
jgi:hypothetical protein